MKFFPKKLNFTWLQENYKNGTLTPAEVAEEIIRRSEEYQDYHIWIVKPERNFIMQYINHLPQQSDAYPLWGIPFAIKDNIDLKGVPTTAGCPDYQYVPSESAFVVEKLIKAGAIPVGKTNLDQFATGLVGTRSPYGEVHNAWDPKLISGGSSSGSAVAVALGMAGFSLGTDTAGSGRVPAALNGLTGYKPPLGAWSTRGVVPACASLDCVTTFANSLADAEQVNLIARGVDAACCWSKKYAEPVAKLPKRILTARGGPQFYGPYKEVYRKKWEQALARIKQCGIPVAYIDYSLFDTAASILYDGPWVAERWADLGAFTESHPGSVFPVTEKVLRSGGRKELTAAQVFRTFHKLQAYRTEVKKLLQDAVLIMPTAGGTFTRDEVRADPVATNSQMGLYTNHCNLLDLCAVAVPENTADSSLPFGISIFALAENESFMMGAAEKFLKTENTLLAVCGLHKHGYPLENQLTELGAHFVESTVTSNAYRLYKFPSKPGLVKSSSGDGAEIAVDLYALPFDQFGQFMRNVHAPLTIGDVQLADGRCVKGFLCEEYAVSQAEDITALGKYTL